LYSEEVLSFGVRQRSFERGRAKFDFDSGVAISWFSIVLISITPPRIIELNEVLGTVEANSSPKRSRECAYSLRESYDDPNPIFQSESITDWQWSCRLAA